ncbi:MAG: ABC transporter ATP-binding protein [Flavobacteriales bacterium]|nr:ABC transporter ATP-binding protein [Flavobacteriales bacterium]
MSEAADILLEVRDLSVHFGESAVVDRVSFTLHSGRCIGLVGASGSGKSVTSLALLGLLDKRHARVSGSALLHVNGSVVDLLALDDEALRRHRGKDLAMVFQEPMTALNPVYSVGAQVAEAIILHQQVDAEKARARVVELFREVQLPDPERLYDRYPHQLSGGQKQRVVIALALSCDPRVLICDEPTTALDVLVQREVLDLLRKLQRERRMGMLFITHDLGVVREVADSALVMHRGRVVEQASVQQLFNNPQHPYTQGLIACRPNPAQHPVRLPTVDEFLNAAQEDTAGLPTKRELSPNQRAEHLRTLMQQEPLLRVEGLNKRYPGARSLFRKAAADAHILHDLSFSVYPGETLGLVGGSGSGKTTLGRSILRLIEPSSGHVYYRGRDLPSLSNTEMRQLRRELQIVFQDPYSALNPRLAVGRAILEAMRVHGIGANDTARRARIHALLERVGLEAAHFDRFPHQFSGGQRQRIVIARAIALEPRLVICDESVAALDVSVQAQVLNLLNDLKDEHGLTYLFISHDLAVVKYFCDRVLVLEQGRQAELGPADAVYDDPQAPYTKRLVEAVPGRG